MRMFARRAWPALAAILFCLAGISGVAAAAPPSPPPFAVLSGTLNAVSVTNTSAATALPSSVASATAITVLNNGTKDAFVALGGSSVSATTSSTVVHPGIPVVLYIGSSTYIAAITGGSDTTTLTVYQGNGPVLARSGGSGNSSGGSCGSCLLAANNLSDVSSTATSLANLGAAPAGTVHHVTVSGNITVQNFTNCDTFEIDAPSLTLSIAQIGGGSPLPTGSGCAFINTGLYAVTLAPNAADKINGGTTGASLGLTQGQPVQVTASANSSIGFVVTNTPVTSVSNNDSTLTVSPTTGAVIAVLNTGHANAWTATQSGCQATLTPSGTAFTPSTTCNDMLVNLSANSTMVNPGTSVPSGLTYGSFIVCQDSTGSRTLTFGTQFLEASGAGAPVLSTAANACDTIPYRIQTNNQYLLGSVILNPSHQ